MPPYAERMGIGRRRSPLSRAASTPFYTKRPEIIDTFLFNVDKWLQSGPRKLPTGCSISLQTLVLVFSDPGN